MAEPSPNRPAGSPELACAVLAVGAPAELADAVRSLLGPGEPVEVVVVSSGAAERPGAAAALLAAEGLEGVPVVERPERLLPGAARNLGVSSTRAPFLAFLAADCWAEPGWVESRLRAHRAGAAAVASAVTNPFRTNLSAWASYVALYPRRMPGAPPADALRYGVSYARELFDRFGLFREDLRGGEDTDFHQRLAGQVEIAWEPAVRTAHRHPRRLLTLLRDQYRRGARSARAWARLQGPGPREVALNALRRLPYDLRLAWRHADAADRPWVAAAGLVLPAAALAYSAGALRADLRTALEDEP